MAKTYRKHLSFQAGEISPLFLGQSDSDVYQKGLAIAENVVIDKRGSAIKRGGLEFIARIDGDNARLFTIQTSRTRYYIILITDLKMTLIAPGAGVIGINLLLNPRFVSGGANWITLVDPAASRVDFSSGECQLLPSQDLPELVLNPDFDLGGSSWNERTSHPQSDVSFANSSCVLSPRQQGGNFAGIFQAITTSLVGQAHEITIVGDFSSGVCRVRIGVAEADGTYLDQEINPSGTNGSITIAFTPAASPFTITLDSEFPAVVTTLRSVSILEPIARTSAITQEGTVTAAITDLHVVVVAQFDREPFQVLIGTTSGASDIASFSTTETEFTATFVPNNATYFVTVLADGAQTQRVRLGFVGTAEEIPGTGLGIEMVAPWTEAQLDEIHLIESPQGQAFYFTHPNVQTQKLIYVFSSDTFTTLTDVTFVSKPVEWTGTNWPSTGTFFQSRLWLGGTPNERQTIWGSKSDAPEDFDQGAALDDESLELVIREFGRIEWMLGTKSLLVGTERGEHIITSGSNDSTITPSTFNIQQQSSYGSNSMQGVQVAEKVFYLTPDGRKLRAMSYQWQEDNWMSDDLTYIAEHITKGIGKVGVWAQHPASVFALLLEDGTLATMTYDRTGNTIAWTRLIATGSKIIDITTGRSNGINEIVTVSQRVPGKLDLATNSGGKAFLDSYIRQFDAGGTNIVTGLDHLEGLEVRPIVDGAVDPTRVVVGGQITTQTSGVEIFVGLDYTAKIQTLPPDVPNTQIRSFRKRWNKVWALMLASNVPIINGVRPPDRTPSTPMNTAEPPTSEHFKSIDIGWDESGVITIEQDLPVAMHVLAIYGELNAETL